MERNEETPDVRFWTAYDHFMFEREARVMRRQHMRAMALAWWSAAKARIARSLKHAGAQPMKAQRTTA